MPAAPSPAELAAGLHSRLPAELHEHVIPLAELIAAYINNTISEAQFYQRATAHAQALAALNNQAIQANGTLINFGSHAQMGDPTFGDVVGGSKIVITVNGTQSRPLGDLPIPPACYEHTSPALPERLIGRDKLFQTLNTWFNGPKPLLMLEAHGGTGKTALVATWLRDYVDGSAGIDGIVYWSCYATGNDLRTMVRYTLAYCEKRNLYDPELQHADYQVCFAQLQRCLKQGRYLLVIDDAERILWGYAQGRHHVDSTRDPHFHDCTDPRDEALLRELMRSPKTKTLLVTRHVPRFLRDGSRVRSDVAHHRLSGLSLPAARELFDAHGVRWSDQDQGQLDRLLWSIGCHPLAITQIAGLIRRTRRYEANGSFDQWYQVQGQQLNLDAITQIEERRERVLDAALADLDAEQAWLLYRIAFVFDRPVTYDDLTILNDRLPDPPPLTDLPALPFYEGRPHPFGSRSLAVLRARLDRLKASQWRFRNPFDLPPLPPRASADEPDRGNPFDLSPFPSRSTPINRSAEIAQLQAQIDQEEAAETERNSDIGRRRAQFGQRLERVRQEREQRKARHQQAYEASAEHQAADDHFNQLLDELEARGLLEYEHERYNMHPLVRQHVLRRDPPRPEAAQTKRIDHFARVPKIDPETVYSVDQLMRAIAAYRLHILDGDSGYAANNYFSLISTPLWRMGEHLLTIELLGDLFPRNPTTQQPDFSERPRFTGLISGNLSRVINDLAVSLSEIGLYAEALQLLTTKLDPEVADKGSELITGVNNFAWLMGYLNQFARMHRAYSLVDATASAGLAWSRQRLLRYAVRTGQWAEADALYAECQQRAAEVADPKPWYAALTAQYARMQVLRRHPDAEAALQAAFTAAEATGERYRLESIYYDWAVLHLRERRYVVASERIHQALEIDRDSGRSTGRGLSLLARIVLVQGDETTARDLLEQALGDPRIPPGDRATVYCNAAEVALRLHDEAAAAAYAHEAYTYAWADGPPHCHAPILERAQAILTVLDLPAPELPAFQADLVEPLPHEASIRTRLEQGDPAPTKQPAFQMRRFTWVQAGTLAAFGVDDSDLVVSIATKINSLSYLPAPLTVSRMGEEVPVCDDPGVPAAHHALDELSFTPAERQVFNKLFVILYLESIDEVGAPIYGYGNVRLDRLNWLLARGEKDEPFNLADYCTTVEVGAGAPSDVVRAKLRNEYLFGEHCLTVRLFPPLDQV